LAPVKRKQAMNIIVTGASRGIGYELVKLFAGDSRNTIIAVARNTEKLARLRSECLEANPAAQVIALDCDLGDEAAVKSLASRIQQHFSSVQVLVNNAGAIVNKPFADITLQDLQRVYTINVFSVVSLIQQLLPMMDPQQRTHVVNISSMGGFQGSAKFAGLSAYSSSKAAVACLTECLAEEFKDKNIAFNSLALGAAQTEMLDEAFPGYKAPLSAKQMAGFIASFSLTAHQYLNGKVIPVSMSNP